MALSGGGGGVVETRTNYIIISSSSVRFELLFSISFSSCTLFKDQDYLAFLVCNYMQMFCEHILLNNSIGSETSSGSLLVSLLIFNNTGMSCKL